jgi:tetratricopeptide (TPR) repeat protein
MDTRTAKKVRKVGRASRTLGQLWQVPAFLLGLLALALVAATAPLRQDMGSRDFDDDVDQLRSDLRNGDGSIRASVSLAESVLGRLEAYPSKAAAVHYLVGTVYLRLSEELAAAEAETARQQAIVNLEKALALGVAEDDHAALLYRLGQALFRSGTDLPRALDLLAGSVDRGTDQPAQGYGMLVQGYMRLPTPNLDKALAASQKQLELTEDEKELWKTYLVRGELFLRKGQKRKALEELEHIKSQAPRELRRQACILQTQCCEDEGLWNRAIPLWKELLTDPTGVRGGKARILYALGMCYHHGDPADDKAAAAAWQEVTPLGGDEAQAAGLRLGALLLETDPARGLAEWSVALARVASAKDYQNRLLPPQQAGEIFENAWRTLLERQDFARALETLELYRKVARPGGADERRGQILEAWARNLEEQVPRESPQRAEALRQKVSARYIEAGQAFEKAAQARQGDSQARLLWRSVGCFLPAKDYPRAAAALEKFLELNNSEEALAEGWLTLAHVCRHQGESEQARRALLKCIVYPNTPFAYRARYLLAYDAQDKGELEQAEDILKQNLEIQGPSLDREAHARSLYLLADLMIRRRNFDQAGWYLKEAVRQYPNDAQALTARDQLGACYEKLAQEINKKMEGTLAAEARAYLKRSRDDWLKKALETYQDLADDLERAGPANLSAENQALLRKAAFRAAAAYFDLEEYTEALRRFQLLLDKYRGEREGLLACMRIQACGNALFKSSSPENRRKALEAVLAAVQKTRADVEKLPREHEAFRGTMTQEECLRWLSQVEQQVQEGLNRLTNPPAPRPPVLQ